MNGIQEMGVIIRITRSSLQIGLEHVLLCLYPWLLLGYMMVKLHNVMGWSGSVFLQDLDMAFGL